MKEIRTEIEINATPEKIWSVLTDFKSYEQWNPFIKSIDGKPEKEEKLTVIIQPPGGKPMTFKPKVLVFEREKEFRWLGHLFISGLFDGEHYFQIRQTDENSCLFIHGEKFKGILTSLLGSTLNKAEKGFNLMNKALKVRCEVM